MSRQTVSKGDRVINQNDKGDCFYVVDNGSYEVRVDPDGTRADAGPVVHHYNDTGHFGELALMYGQPRAATVIVTSEKGHLWQLDSDAFHAIIGPSAHAASEALVRTLL